jgi:hypothetical protein
MNKGLYGTTAIGKELLVLTAKADSNGNTTAKIQHTGLAKQIEGVTLLEQPLIIRRSIGTTISYHQ